MSKKLLAGLIALMMSFSMGEVAAQGNQVSGGGIVIAWNDKDLVLPPSKFSTPTCGPIYFDWRNVGPSRMTFSIQLTNSTGQTRSQSEFEREPGSNGRMFVQTCGASGNWVGPLRLDLFVNAASPSKSNVGTVTITVSSSAPQAVIDVVRIPCSIEKRKRFCGNEQVLRFRDGGELLYGDSDWIALFNQRGKVDVSTDAVYDASMANDKATEGTVYARPATGQFVKGNYAVVLGTGSEPSWRCTQYVGQVNCRWDKGFATAVGYKFKWNGSKVTSVKRLTKKEVRAFNLR